MSKTANADIRNLFRKFGGDTGSYQEIQQEYVAEKAQKNWPIVNAIEKAQASAPTLKASGRAGSSTGSFAAQTIPPVARRAAPGGASVVAQPMSSASRTVESSRPAAPASPLFGKLHAESAPSRPAAPASPLFGKLHAESAPSRPAAPASPLFGKLHAESAPSRPAAPASPLFGKLHAESASSRPAALASPLFGKLHAESAPSHPAAPASPLFGSKSPVGSVSAQGRAAGLQPRQAHRPENDSLQSLFLRLNNQQAPGGVPLPENGLRSMFGFLKK